MLWFLSHFEDSLVLVLLHFVSKMRSPKLNSFLTSPCLNLPLQTPRGSTKQSPPLSLTLTLLHTQPHPSLSPVSQRQHHTLQGQMTSPPAHPCSLQLGTTYSLPQGNPFPPSLPERAPGCSSPQDCQEPPAGLALKIFSLAQGGWL